VYTESIRSLRDLIQGSAHRSHNTFPDILRRERESQGATTGTAQMNEAGAVYLRCVSNGIFIMESDPSHVRLPTGDFRQEYRNDLWKSRNFEEQTLEGAAMENAILRDSTHCFSGPCYFGVHAARAWNRLAWLAARWLAP
jgi:hypothetical protein